MHLSRTRSWRGAPVASAVALLLALSSVAYGLRLPERRFTIVDGLVSDSVSDIFQDHEGFLWIATDDGISRFDGVAFRNFGMENGLPYPGVSSIAETADGRVWAATREGLCWMSLARRSEDQGWRRVLLPGGSMGNSVDLVRADGLGTLWVFTLGGVFTHRVGAPVSQFEPVKLPLRKGYKVIPEATGVVPGSEGVLWFATNEGLLERLPDAVFRWVRIVHEAKPPRIGAITLGPRGDLWIFTSDQRLLKLRPGTAGVPAAAPRRRSARKEAATEDLSSQIEAIPPPVGHQGWWILDLSVFRNTVWAGTPWGVCQVESDHSRCFAHGDLADPVTALGRDAEGNLWVGTESHGLVRLTNDGLVSFGREDGVLYGRFGEFLIGPHQEPCALTGGQKCLLVCRAGRHFVSTPILLPSGSNYSWGWNQILARGRRGGWWLGTFSGVLRFGPSERVSALSHPSQYRLISETTGLPSNNVFRIALDHLGNLWVGTLDGSRGSLSVIDHNGDGIHVLAGATALLEHDAVTAFLDDGRGSMWMGTYDGRLLRYSSATRSIDLVPGWPRGAGLIWDLYIDHARHVWVGTSTLGAVEASHLASVKPVFTPLGRRQGLSSNRIRCITEDESGQLYFGSDEGIDQYSPATARIRHLGTEDGLPNSEVNVCGRDRSGYLWFGTLDGLARFDPRERWSECTPRVEFESFIAGGERRPLASGVRGVIHLATRDRDIRVRYAGACLAAGDRLRYQHKLVGLTNRWSAPSAERSVTYAELAPGDYRFEVRALNSEGVISVLPARVSFEIPPPFWQRSWFVAIVAGLVLALAYGGHRMRLARLLAAERLRTRIATDLHDELGSGLSRISILSEVIQRELAPESRRQIRRLDEIGRSARDLIEATSDMVWSIDPRRDDLASLLSRLRRFGSELFESAGVRWRLEAPRGAAEIRLGTDQRRHLLLILKEALNNALRHGRPSAVDVRIEVKNGRRLAAQVHDDGCGFDPAELAERTSARLGYGLASMVERARSVDGQLSIDSEPGKGTRISLSIPLTRARSWRGA